MKSYSLTSSRKSQLKAALRKLWRSNNPYPNDVNDIKKFPIAEMHLVNYIITEAVQNNMHLHVLAENAGDKGLTDECINYAKQIDFTNPDGTYRNVNMPKQATMKVLKMALTHVTFQLDEDKDEQYSCGNMAKAVAAYKRDLKTQRKSKAPNKLVDDACDLWISNAFVLVDSCNTTKQLITKWPEITDTITETFNIVIEDTSKALAINVIGLNASIGK